MITISKPQVVKRDGYARLIAELDVDGDRRTVWFEVDCRFEQYLCWERSDAFIVGILNYAMTSGHDITCEAPVGEYLYYNLTRHFIEPLSRNSSGLHPTRIIADVDSNVLENAGAVGTGFSCGIDSFHALVDNLDPRFPRHKVTHLAFYNVGSHHGEGEGSRTLYLERREHVKRFAEEYGFEYVQGDSNIIEQFPQEHYFVHIYSNMFAVLCLQKLYSIYYYASASPYSGFSLKDSERYTPDRYELLSVFAFSTDTMKVYSEGGSITRFEKTQKIASHPSSYKYLNVCLVASDNCGVCHKCRRTMMDLYALGALDRYAEVFDLDYFHRNKAWYLAKSYAYYLTGNAFYTDSYRLLKKEFTLPVKIRAIPTYVALLFKNMRADKRKAWLPKN